MRSAVISSHRAARWRTVWTRLQAALRDTWVNRAWADRRSIAVNGPLTARLRRLAQALFTQVSRNAACNRVHTVRQRAARWLLTTADRMDSPRFALTQHFLAQMLAVRRTSVSEVAQSLAEDGCITYTRGRITITDRPRLLSHACNCYEAIRWATDAVLAAR